MQTGQHFGVDGIGFGKLSETFGKVVGLARIDANDFQACGDEEGEDFAFESAGGFEDDLFGLTFFETFDNFLDSLNGMLDDELAI